MSQLTFIQRYFLILVLLTPMAPGQSVDCAGVPDNRQSEDQLQDLLLKVRNSNYDPLISGQAIPALREAFDNATDVLTK